MIAQFSASVAPLVNDMLPPAGSSAPIVSRATSTAARAALRCATVTSAASSDSRIAVSAASRSTAVQSAAE